MWSSIRGFQYSNTFQKNYNSRQRFRNSCIVVVVVVVERGWNNPNILKLKTLMYSKIFMLLAAVLIFASCEKDNIDRTKTKTKTGEPSETQEAFDLAVFDKDENAVEGAMIDI